jgi:triphosphatase
MGSSRGSGEPTCVPFIRRIPMVWDQSLLDPIMPPYETELKLEVDVGALRKLRGHPLTRRLLRSGPHTERLRSVYFDTSDRALQRAGMELRVRRSPQAAASIQTLKANVGKGAYQRREWEMGTRTPEEGPDFSGLFDRVDADFGTSFLRTVGGAGVLPVFHTDIRRTTWQLAEGEWEVEAALDRGAIVAGPRRELLFELELELKRGAPIHLQSLALELLDAVPFRLLWASKSERGYRLASGGRPDVPRWVSPALPKEARVGEVLRSIGHSCRQQLLSSQSYLPTTDNPEAIHQLRVGARRLRSALRLFRTALNPSLAEPLEEDLRWIMAELGPVRDLHVLLSKILRPVRLARPDDGALQRLELELRKRLAVRSDHAGRVVLSSRFTRLILRIGVWLEGGILPVPGNGVEAPFVGARAFAQGALHRLDRQVRRRGRNLQELPGEELHRLRIRVKRLRYAGECFAPLFPGARGRKKWLRSIRALQDRLGDLQDLVVAEGLLTDLPLEVRNPDGHRGAGMVIGWHMCHRKGQLAAAVQAFEGYAKRRRFWR